MEVGVQLQPTLGRGFESRFPLNDYKPLAIIFAGGFFISASSCNFVHINLYRIIMKTTSILLTILLTTLLSSCSSNSDRLIAAFTSEIGTSSQLKAQGNSKISYTWPAVSIVKKDVLKSIADKELKMSPTATQDMGVAVDENGNPVMGKIQQSWTYETPDNKTELIYQMSGSTIDVILTVTKK